MAQPAISPLDFTPPLGERRGPDPASRGLEGPANRALSELTLALSGGEAEEGAWSMGKTLRFILIGCGAFWLAAAVASYMLF